ncbi:MAG: LytTR family DNA-binding domain-containing protein [Croceivirga sp.]
MMIPHSQFFSWLYYDNNQRLGINVGIALFILIFLAVTLPFGMSHNNLNNYLEVLLLILSFSLLWIIVSYLLDYMCTFLTTNKRTTIIEKSAKTLLLKFLVFVHVILVYRGYLCDWTCMNTLEYLELVTGGTLMFILIYVPLSFYAKNLYQEAIAGKPRNEEGNSRFELKGAGKKPFCLYLENVVFFKADDNYVDISIIAEGIKIVPVRITISSLEKQFYHLPQFIRVHRSFMVNLNYFKRIDNKKSFLYLTVNQEDYKIPISKKYQKQTLNLLNHMH